MSGAADGRSQEATTVEPPLARVTRDYGDVAAEYAAVRSGVGVADRDDLGVVVLTGRDPVRMIQGLMTNDLAAAAEGRAAYGAMLTPKGRTIAELRAFRAERDQGAEVRLLIPREVLNAATDHLRRSIPPLYARWRDASAEYAVLGLYGPRAREVLGAVLSIPAPALGEDEVASGEAFGAPVHVIGTAYAGGEPGFDLLVPPDTAAPLRQALLAAGGEGARRVGFDALEILRVEGGVPRGGRELTEETIPTEAYEATGLMERAISFTKGCYTGQEVIVRIAHRGHVNRLLRGIVTPRGLPLPQSGARLFHRESGKDIGWITSAVDSLALGRAVALGYVRREVEPGHLVRLGEREGPEVQVASLPFVHPPRGGDGASATSEGVSGGGG